MRLSALLLATLLFAASCDREAKTPDGAEPQETQDATYEAAGAISAPVSDELPGLPAPATGIAFWDHPTLSFNGLMIVATEAGVIGYSMEDGVEVTRIDGVNANGLGVGYLGVGPQAAGFVAVIDGAENAFFFYGVDNQTRAFLPLNAGPSAAGVKGFCLGRGADAATPSLFAIQRGRIRIYNLAASASGVQIESEAELAAPNDLVSCAVDLEGALLAADEDGDIFRLAGEDSFAAPFARAPSVARPGPLAVIPAAMDEGARTEGLIFLAGLGKGQVAVFDSTGEALGAVVLEGTGDMPAVGAAQSFGATGANFGALYRNGVIAFGVSGAEGGPAVRIAPASTVKNALAVPLGEPVSPRGGAAPAAADTLLIPPTELEPIE